MTWAACGAEPAGPVSRAIFRVARLHRLLAGQLLRSFGLHAGQEVLMMRLWETGRQRQSELMRVLDQDASTLTRMVQRLEQSGFVRRCPDPGDRRSMIVEPTPAGMALRAQVTAAWEELEATTLDGLGEKERQAAERLLGRLEANLCRAVGRDQSLGAATGPAAGPVETP
ncbi:MarR family winged helix-turn-helix transcriptional regulator [Streptomyces sp. KR80]|uniref:MarR family winged helix-turn-helix transcriptional regulator n=1 Tax=Streptomyces sp. KR80 TaxID=3457426 RepID=UPI003FD31A66